jgi:hypothetical protein
MVSKVLQPPITDIQKKQNQVSSQLRKVSNGYQNFNKEVAIANTNIDKKIQEYNDKISNISKNTETDLNGQYNMYKTGLSNDANVVADLIKQIDTKNSSFSEKITNAQNETKQYADNTKRIYDDVFGATTAKVIRQDNSEFQPADSMKQGFTTIDDTNYAKPNSNNKNLFHLENNLINELNTFNTIYYSYVRCYSSGNCDVGNRKTIDDVTNQATIVNNAIANLKNEYEKQNIQTKENVFIDNHQEILNNSKSIDELRRGLDAKMDTILQKNKSSIETKQYDATVYTGILWSILAILILFYIFIEM